MILNIRGTSGSGKSTLVTTLMERDPDTSPIWSEDKRRIVGYELRPYATGRLRVVGKYETACGGCDGIKTQDEVCERVREYAPMGPVLFEGLLISHIYARYQALHHELTAGGHGPYYWLFLDTPLEVCLDNVRKRREARGKTTPLDPTNTVQKWHDARRVFDKARADGLDPMWVPYDDAANWALELLAGRDPRK